MANTKITSGVIADDAVLTANITDANVTTAKIAADAVTSAKVADDAINSEHLAADSIDAEHYAAGSVDATAIASNAVTTAKINDDAVTTAKIADAQITTALMADDSITSAKLDTNIAIAGTLDSTGKITADAGIDIDNFNIDGTTIALSSGDMTLDVAGNIQLDADDAGEVRFIDGGTTYATIKKDGNNALFQSIVADGDFIIQGIDGSSFVSAVTFDMSEGGKMTTSGDIAVGADVQMANGRGISFAASSNHSGMSSELSDDYEEGTCTMSINGTGTNPTIAEGSTFTAYYTKVGNMVTVTGYTGTKTITNAGSGIAQISGLPFPCKSGAYAVVLLGHNTMFTSTDTGYIEPTTSTWYPIGSHTTGGHVFPTGAKVFMFTATYLAS